MSSEKGHLSLLTSHFLLLISLIRLTTSPGSACRPVARLEYTSVSSAVTSNRPPDDCMSTTSASGNSRFSSAARPEALGW